MLVFVSDAVAERTGTDASTHRVKNRADIVMKPGIPALSAQLGRVLDIQKFSIHDGPGIRTTVFLKGCPLACAWCCNPGGQKLAVLPIQDPTDPSVTQPDSFDRTVDEVVDICLQDRVFYEESGGGVTLSGGEPLVQHPFALALIRRLHDEGIHTAIETTGHAPAAIFERARREADLVIMDVKHHDPEAHRQWTGVTNTRCLANLRAAVTAGGDLLVRIPVIPGVNDSLDDARAFAALLAPIGVHEVQLMPFHQFGERKYELLGWPYRMAGVPTLHDDDLAGFKETLAAGGVRTI